jgi:hypothetical protein
LDAVLKQHCGVTKPCKNTLFCSLAQRHRTEQYSTVSKKTAYKFFNNPPQQSQQSIQPFFLKMRLYNKKPCKPFYIWLTGLFVVHGA